MKRQTLYTVLDKAGAPGAATSVVWHPQRVSPQVRKLAEGAIRQLVCPWQFQCKAGQLVHLLMPKDVPYVRYLRSHGTHIKLPNESDRKALRKHLNDMLEALSVADKLVPAIQGDRLREEILRDLSGEFDENQWLTSITSEASLVNFMQPFTVQYATQIEQAVGRLHSSEPIVLLDEYVHTRKPRTKKATSVSLTSTEERTS
jgi:hypothetical protein